MNTMPFNIDRLSNGKVFISNLAGFHSFVDDDELHLLAKDNFPPQQTISRLLESRLLTAVDSNQLLQASIIQNINFQMNKIPKYVL